MLCVIIADLSGNLGDCVTGSDQQLTRLLHPQSLHISRQADAGFLVEQAAEILRCITVTFTQHVKGERFLTGGLQLIRNRRYDWHGGTVLNILNKQEYMGHTVNFRTRKVSYKSKKKVDNPPEEWVIFENTHEAIVDADTWYLAQHEKGTKTRIDSVGLANPLTGLMFCADCGAKMYNSRHRNERNNDASGLHFDTYNCSTYSNTRIRETRICSNHHTLAISVVRDFFCPSVGFFSLPFSKAL